MNSPASQPQNRVPQVSILRPGFAEPPRPTPTTRTSGPQLVPHHPTPHTHHSPLALWHLLSLDAPTVATLWTIFIARCSHITLPWTAPAAMFVAVWMIYAADRLLDARILDDHPHHPDLEARHRFHHQHRTRFLTALVLSALALTTLIPHLDPQSLHLYALLATLLSAWMLLIHIIPNSTTRRLPKELAVGLFFPAAIFIPTLARTTPTPAALQTLGWLANWLRPTLLPAAILFASICTLNCLYLYAWEHPTPTRNTAHSTTRWATEHLTHLAIGILTLSTITSAICLQRHALTTGLPALACALSAVALLTLNTLRRRLTPIHLRAAADLVLLTPLLLLPFTR
jgi:hypothetical protein